MRVHGHVNFANESLNFQVFTFEQRQDASEAPAEAAFDVVMVC